MINEPGGIGTSLTGSGTAQTTGRYVVVFADADVDPAPMLESVAGLSNVVNSRDFDEQRVDGSGADATVFAELGVAVVSLDPTQLASLRSSGDAQRAILSISPELVYHPLVDSSYLAGYQDGITDLSARINGGASKAGGPLGGQIGVSQFRDTADFTWGLQATQVVSSPHSGQGIKVAVLDTGFELSHPDFVGRSITSASFITGESAQDGHGHGTHCTGTACGSKKPAGSRRYGIAYESEIFIGKVLSDSGSGTDESVLAGINWAITQGCHVISMSLGADVPEPHPPYTQVGERALDKGSLIIAAAGNNADRGARNWGFVGAPANSPFILAVAAVEEDLSMAFFSARSLTSRGGQVDNAAPGRRVYSSWLMPQKYNTISGTSMATPHVAGVAALWAQSTGLRARELWSVLAQEGDRLYEPSVDVGVGLVLAPQ